jgi:hypothetical protein
MIDPLLLTSARVTTYQQSQLLTNASGFFFERNDRLFLVTSLHVMSDQKSGHQPDRLEIELHNNPENLAESVQFSIPLHNNAVPLWRGWTDCSGKVDIAVIELESDALPEKTLFHVFTPDHLPRSNTSIAVGSRLLIVGFPLGFHDTLHHSAVVRQAALASAFGLRFQGLGVFLTDARTHRGSSGAPVVMHTRPDGRMNPKLPYLLLGVHSSRFDSDSRDTTVDEALGLNCAWYANVLLSMTE